MSPRELNIVRSKVLARNRKRRKAKRASRFISPYYAESKLSPDTLTKIRRLILKEDKMANKDNTQNSHGSSAYYKGFALCELFIFK